MAELTDLLLAEGRSLTKYRELLERIQQKRLQPDDLSMLSELLAKEIDQAEAAGQEYVTIELPEEEGGSTGKKTDDILDVED